MYSNLNSYMSDYEYTVNDLVYVNFYEWWGNEDTDKLYFNKGTVENPQWEEFNGGNILAQDIIDGKLAYSGTYLGIYGTEFSFDQYGESSQKDIGIMNIYILLQIQFLLKIYQEHLVYQFLKLH